MRRTLAMMAILLAAGLLGAIPPRAALAAEAPADRVVVMYFHRTQRCPTCQTMGSYTEEAVAKGLASEVKAGRVSLHFIDFQDPRNAAYTQAYAITGPTLLVAKGSGGKVVEYKNLKEMWVKVRDKEAFLEYVQSNVKAYLR